MTDLHSDRGASAERAEAAAIARPRVRIVGNHPHKGEIGSVCDDLPMRMGMWQIELDPGHGVNGCFAGPENLRPLGRDEDPYA